MTAATIAAATERAGNWRNAAACLHADPNLFFPVSMNGRAILQVADAKAICALCPVPGECLE